MITSENFEMIETISLEALVRHPVWATFEEALDRETLLGWGVACETLEREITRYEYCGHQPLYPVLQCDPLPPQSHLIVRVSFEAANDLPLEGYLLAPYAFGIFVNGREFCFNRNLPTVSKKVADALQAVLSLKREELFPLRYTSELRWHEGGTVCGEVAPAE